MWSCRAAVGGRVHPRPAEIGENPGVVADGSADADWPRVAALAYPPARRVGPPPRRSRHPLPGTNRMTPHRTARLLLDCLEGRAMPSTFTVTTTLDVVDPSDGRLSLREAIGRANDHPGADTVVLPAGVFRVALAGAGEDGNLTGDFDVTDSTLLLGAGAGATVLDGQRLDRVFDVFGTAPGSIRVALRGLTVRNGLVDAGGGGGIRVGDADLVVRACVVTGNRAPGGGGGGISNAALPGTGDVTLARTVVSRNVADGDGGGVSVLGDGQGRGSVLTVVASTVRRNLAGNAGGIRAARLNLTDSAVTGNATNNNAGGIWADTATLADCTVSGNTCDNIGGGILATSATLTGSRVAGNFADDVGGGIAGGDLTLVGSTVSGNTASGEGGGISAGTVRLVGSTVAGNFADFGGGIAAGTATLDASTVSGNAAGNAGGGIRATTAILTNSTV